MKRIQWGVLLLCAFLTVAESSTVMRITVQGNITETSLASISKIAFSGDSLRLFDGGVYALDNISKIEFYEDGATNVPMVEHEINDHNRTTQDAMDHLRIIQVGTHVQLQLPKATYLEVFLCNLKGQIIKTLFDDNAKAGMLHLSLKDKNLSSAINTIVVKMANEIYVKKFVDVKGGSR